MNSINIRSITYSIDLKKIKNSTYQDDIKNNINKIVSVYKENNTFIRTVRLNVLVIDKCPKDDKIFIEELKILSSFATSIDVRWFNLAFDLTNMSQKDQKRITKLSYYIIKKFENAFINFIIAKDNEINVSASLITAKLIVDVSQLSSNGFDNFRVGVSLNPKKYTPFFPFSYSNKENSFSIAMEITEEFLNIVEKESTLENIKKSVYKNIGEYLSKINTLGLDCNNNEMEYNGMDISLAPFPDKNISVVEILHKLGLDEIGASGTYFYTSILTDIIKSTLNIHNIKSVGFNGVMYSLLEDHLLCNANNRKMLSINQFIAYSTMCGCGLDMVPVPGNILIEELSSIILDTAAVAVKLDKPLGVRVLPIPNKENNEFTEFDMDFLTNTRIVNLKNLYGDDSIFEMKNLVYDNKGHK